MKISGIGNRIINLRDQKGWSQKELAERVGFSPSVMNRIESEERPIKDYELDIIASILGTTSDFLLGRELYEHGIRYDSLEKTQSFFHLLDLQSLPEAQLKELKNIDAEDIEDIKKHIQYIIYRAKIRKK